MLELTSILLSTLARLFCRRRDLMVEADFIMYTTEPPEADLLLPPHTTMSTREQLERTDFCRPTTQHPNRRFAPASIFGGRLPMPCLRAKSNLSAGLWSPSVPEATAF
jgi:hypothetical protein